MGLAEGKASSSLTMSTLHIFIYLSIGCLKMTPWSSLGLIHIFTIKAVQLEAYLSSS